MELLLLGLLILLMSALIVAYMRKTLKKTNNPWAFIIALPLGFALPAGFSLVFYGIMSLIR